MDFPTICESVRVKRLFPPRGVVNMVLDTDAFNQSDNQFALVYALLSQDRINVKAITAAPFYNDKSSSPADGMEKSYKEVSLILKKMNLSSENFLFHGSLGYLPKTEAPCPNEGMAQIIKLARETHEDRPLYIAALGALTNIAGALLSAPDIIHKIVVVWLGGHAYYWPHTREFNLKQDMRAARIVFNSGVPLIHIPCLNVADHLTTTPGELKYSLKGQGSVGNFLLKRFNELCDKQPGSSKVLWDMAPIAWLVNPDWLPSELDHSPLLNDSLTWSRDNTRHFIRTVKEVHRDEIFQDFFAKMGKYASEP
jgi:purine nucleosidase